MQCAESLSEDTLCCDSGHSTVVGRGTASAYLVVGQRHARGPLWVTALGAFVLARLRIGLRNRGRTVAYAAIGTRAISHPAGPLLLPEMVEVGRGHPRRVDGRGASWAGLVLLVVPLGRQDASGVPGPRLCCRMHRRRAGLGDDRGLATGVGTALRLLLRSMDRSLPA